MLLARTKDAKIVCVIANNEASGTRIHTLIERLAVLAMIINCIPTRMHVSSNKTVSETKKRMMYSPGSPYIVVAPANGWYFYICIFRHESR